MQKLLTKKEVAAICGCHPETIARLVRDGKFPKPVRLGSDGPKGHVRWPEGDVNDWLAGRIAARA